MTQTSPPAGLPETLAALLAGSWRRTPAACELSVELLERALPLLAGSGAAALGWRSIRDSAGLATSAPGQALKQAAQLLALEDARMESALAALGARFAEAGLRAVLIKGRAVAQCYAESWLRPYGDFDLVAHPDDADAMEALLHAVSDPRGSKPRMGQFMVRAGINVTVDFHRDLDELGHSAIDAARLHAGARPSSHNGFLLPNDADHLRIVALHLLKHGAWRPLWLCDVAAMVEAAGEEFDWERCLGAEPVARAWIVAAIGAARALLGCRTDHLPAGLAEAATPAWMTAAILREWRQPYAGRFSVNARMLVRAPGDYLAAHWPNAIATGFLGGLPPARRPARARQLTACFVALTRRFIEAGWWRGRLGRLGSRAEPAHTSGAAIV